MKVITTKIPDETHTKLRIYVLMQGTTVSDLVKRLIEKELEKEGENAETKN